MRLSELARREKFVFQCRLPGGTEGRVARLRSRRQHRSSVYLAQSGHHAAEFQCPLFGVKQTFLQLTSMSAFDPKRTSPSANVTTSNIPVWPTTMRLPDLGGAMRRREFMTLLGSAATWPLAAHAKIPVVAFLSGVAVPVQ